MPDVQLFTNKPKFCQQDLSTSDILNLPFINMNVGELSDPNNFGMCGDPTMGTLLQKNLVHIGIHCGGKPIDLNWMRQLFPNQQKTMVDSKRWYNQYICDQDLNIFFAASATATGPGLPFYAQILKSKHSSNGNLSMPAVGYSLFDKDNQILYTITDVDTTTPYAHRVELTPNDGLVTGSVKANVGYLVGMSRLVGGCNCAIVTNSASTIGYVQELHPVRVRRDWRVCIDLLTGYQDQFRYAIIYDINGKPYDAWDTYEAIKMREGIQSNLNMLTWIGTPTTNAALISGAGATIDGNHTGFYGFLPTLKYGGGNVYNIPSDRGFDLESDGEAIFLYQDSRKKSKSFLVIHGNKWRMDLVDRTNKLISRTDVGKDMWEAFRRMGSLTGEDNATAIAKLNIDSYKYAGNKLDFKLVDGWSDYRYAGSDYFNGMAIFLAQDGATLNGRQIDPVEFYTYGKGQWTGNYEEHYIDFRKGDSGCNDIGGWAAESLSMGVHCPENHILINPIKAA